MMVMASPRYSLTLNLVTNLFKLQLLQENQEKLFGEIIQFSAKEQQQGGGSGLGLFISKGIIDLHGGNIAVFSKGLGHGCTFYIELPTMSSIAVRKSLDRGISAGNLKSLLSFSKSGQSIKLLVVDDSYLCRKMVSQLLDKFSVESEVAENGQEAVDKVMGSLKSGLIAYDGIIIDGEMPIMDGLQAVKAIRALGFSGRIFGCTGDTNPAMQAAFLAAGADKTFLKPLAEKSFIYMLRGNLRFTFCID